MIDDLSDDGELETRLDALVPRSTPAWSDPAEGEPRGALAGTGSAERAPGGRRGVDPLVDEIDLLLSLKALKRFAGHLGA